MTGVSGGIGQGIAAASPRPGRRSSCTSATIVPPLPWCSRASWASADCWSPVTCSTTVSPTALAAAAVERFGRLDVWVNNAGVQPVAALLEMTAAEFDDVVAGKPRRRSVAPGPRRGAMVDGGAIVNVASIEALQPALGHSHYVAAKAAVVAHTRAAALELGPSGIRVNAVAPGLIDRPGLAEAWPDGVERWLAACPLGRLGEPTTSPTPACSCSRRPRGGSPARCSSWTAGCCPGPHGECPVGCAAPVAAT